MTEQCRAVLAECDFPDTASRTVEQLLCKHSPAQILKLVWGKDQNGEHDIDWFLPFFERGYVKRVIYMDPEPSFTDEFWLAYEQVCELFDMLSSFDMAHIQAMSSDVPRIRKAYNKSPVKKIAYVRKVWEGMSRSVTIERTPVELTIGNSGVNTRDF